MQLVGTRRGPNGMMIGVFQEVPMPMPLPPHDGFIQVPQTPATKYNPHKPPYKERFHISLHEYKKTETIIHFARIPYEGVSVIDITRGGPKVFQGHQLAFDKPTLMDFVLHWPGYDPLYLHTSMSQGVYRIQLAEYLCEAIVAWLKKLKEDGVSPSPGFEKWDVRKDIYDISNLWLWAIRKLKGKDQAWIIDLFVEP
ncbi:hypothetical protein BC835DRAFT_1521891 [Cytidiella melzeri]|nr:hypothetical protein BC835DRAFT_1521891 [Cytidiella melzeri]